MTHYNLKALLKMVLGNFTESTNDGLTVYSGDHDCRVACHLIDGVVKALDRSDSVQRFLFKSGVEWPTTVDETSKGANLKLDMMVLGNRLVTDHDYSPTAIEAGADTRPIQVFTEWVNDNPEVRTILDDLGYDWPVIIKVEA